LIRQTNDLHNLHFGIQWITHDWIGLAIRRRSFHLMSKATEIACRCNILMDDVIVKAMGRACAAGQIKRGHETLPRQRWLDLPPRLKTYLKLTGKTEGQVVRQIGNRLLNVRVCRGGLQPNYMVSPTFVNRCVNRTKIMKTFEDNLMPTMRLYHDEATSQFLLHALNHQIVYHDTMGKKLQSSPIRGNLIEKGGVHKSFVGSCTLCIESLDLAYVVFEYKLNEIMRPISTDSYMHMTAQVEEKEASCVTCSPHEAHDEACPSNSLDPLLLCSKTFSKDFQHGHEKEIMDFPTTTTTDLCAKDVASLLHFLEDWISDDDAEKI